MVKFVLKPTHKRVAGKSKHVSFWNNENNQNNEDEDFEYEDFEYDPKYDPKYDPDRWISGYRDTGIHY